MTDRRPLPSSMSGRQHHTFAGRDQKQRSIQHRVVVYGVARPDFDPQRLAKLAIQVRRDGRTPGTANSTTFSYPVFVARHRPHLMPAGQHSGRRRTARQVVPASRPGGTALPQLPHRQQLIPVPPPRISLMLASVAVRTLGVISRESTDPERTEDCRVCQELSGSSREE